MTRLPITSIDQLDPKATYSYADYLAWQFEEMVELIKGKVYRNMSPAPNRRHQRIAMKLTKPLVNYFDKRTCQLYSAPFDVRLFDQKKSSKQNKDIYTIVQPDLCVVCDLNKLDDQGCLGAPDWIIEIASPATRHKDQKVKLALYEENGVREYWIVFPEINSVAVYELQTDGRYQLQSLYNETDVVPVGIFPDLSIELSEILLED
ncbi:MAG: Uma2 family endonuclease [Saprospiraceae bacterium]|nr:Uma2 family endonuclease [Saprospiraceae bacterium]